jgi:hypothetical protein
VVTCIHAGVLDIEIIVVDGRRVRPALPRAAWHGSKNGGRMWQTRLIHLQAHQKEAFLESQRAAAYNADLGGIARFGEAAMTGTQRQHRRSLAQRSCSALTLVCYLATALNLPLPIPAAGRKPGEPPYPCQDHACGCASAAQCWAACCCMTPEERWAWARANNVEPPAYAERPASASWNTTRLRDQEQPVSTCCAAKAAPVKKECCKSQGPKSRPCCASSKPDDHNVKQPSGTGQKKLVRWMLTVAGLKCQGHGTLWVSSGAAVPPAPPLTWEPCQAAAGRLVWNADFADSLQYPPIIPPPRAASVCA